MSEEKTYTREQIKEAIFQELKRSDHLGEEMSVYYTTYGIVMEGLNLLDKNLINNDKETDS